MTIDFTMDEHPIDLSKELSEWLPRSIVLADAFNISKVADDLRRVEERLKLPSFRLAVVGNIGSGKSAFINRLLGPTCRLPTGWIPTTSNITLIAAGKREQIMVNFPNGRKEQRSLRDSAWADLTAGNDERLNSGELPTVSLTLDNEWLKELSIEIIDTPGIDGLTGPRAKLISKLLSQCDSVVMLVNAAYPLSLTEAAFIEHAIIGQGISCVLVVVSKLDMLLKQGIAQDELLKHFKLIKTRVARVAPQIPVISSQPLTEDENESEVMMALRTQIELLVSKADRKAWRSQQSASFVANHLEQIIKIGQTMLATRQMDKAKKEEAQNRLDNERQRNLLEWKGINDEFIQKRLILEQKIRIKLSNAQNRLIDEAASQLIKAPNPKLWWEKDLPYLAHHTFLSLARRSEALLVNSLANDVRWLEEEVSRRCNVTLTTIKPTLSDPIEIRLDQQSLRLSDFERLNLFMKLGYGASAIIAKLFLSHIGFMVGNIEDLLRLNVTNRTLDNINNPLLNAKIEEQRQKIDQVMRQNIAQIIKEYTNQISIRLAELYEQIAQILQKQEALWEDARIATIMQEEEADKQMYQRLINDAISTKESIISKLYMR